MAWGAGGDASANHALTDLLVGGGLPPLEGQRTEVTVTAMDARDDTTHWTVRLAVDGRVRGAGTLSAGSQATIALPATAFGWVQGYVESDPDDLRADDRRYFAFRARRAPSVAIGGAPGVFVSEAMAVLQRSGRIRAGGIGAAELLIAQDGAGLDARGPGTASLVIPPEDPTLLPALNRRLADARIQWRYEPRRVAGEVELAGPDLPEPLRGARALSWYELAGDAGESPAAPRVLALVADRPWAVEGADGEGRRYLLVASPLVASATTLPVSTGMVRFVDWVASNWAGAGSSPAYEAGDYLAAPPEATRIRFPSGREVDIDATRTVRGTSEAGVYEFVAADTTVALVALNPPSAESRLDVLDERVYESAIGSDVVTVSRADAWPRAVFRRRLGGEAWWPFVLAAALLLIAESFLASSGHRRRGAVPERLRRVWTPRASGAGQGDERRSAGAETSSAIP